MIEFVNYIFYVHSYEFHNYGHFNLVRNLFFQDSLMTILSIFRCSVKLKNPRKVRKDYDELTLCRQHATSTCVMIRNMSVKRIYFKNQI